MSLSPPTSGSTPVSRVGASVSLALSAPAGELEAITTTRTVASARHAVRPCSRVERARKDRTVRRGTRAYCADRIPLVQAADGGLRSETVCAPDTVPG